ncbi:MAG: hypothetical protein FDW93_05660 [Bergeyella sp.]|nr:hypothetical protein [Bergeyella sp.]
MKKIFYFLFVFFLVFSSCKKDPKDAGLANKKGQDSLSISALEHPQSFSVGVIDTSPTQEKTIFSKKGETIISFDHASNTGKIKIDGKEFVLDRMLFTENTYELSGQGLSVLAEDGTFQDSVWGCTEGSFPEVKITYKDNEVTLRDIKVEDCPGG